MKAVEGSLLSLNQRHHEALPTTGSELQGSDFAEKEGAILSFDSNDLGTYLQRNFFFDHSYPSRLQLHHLIVKLATAKFLNDVFPPASYLNGHGPSVSVI